MPAFAQTKEHYPSEEWEVYTTASNSRHRVRTLGPRAFRGFYNERHGVQERATGLQFRILGSIQPEIYGCLTPPRKVFGYTVAEQTTLSCSNRGTYAIQSQVSRHPHVQAAFMVGTGRSQPAIIIERTVHQDLPQVEDQELTEAL